MKMYIISPNMSGKKLCLAAVSATSQLKPPAPWPTSNSTPRDLASITSLSMLRVVTSRMVLSYAWNVCV